MLEDSGLGEWYCGIGIWEGRLFGTFQPNVGGGEEACGSSWMSLWSCDLIWNFFDFLDFFELLEEVGVLVWRMWPEAWGSVWEVMVWTLVGIVIWVVEEMMAWVVERLDGGFVTGSPGFAESSGKTSQTVSYFYSSWSISECDRFTCVKCSGRLGYSLWFDLEILYVFFCQHEIKWLNSIQINWLRESVKCVQWITWKYRNEHGRYLLEYYACINECRAQTMIPLLSENCVN